MIAAGRISTEDIIKEDVRQSIETAILEVGNTTYLTPIKALLPDEVDYNVIRCVVEGWKRKQTMMAGGMTQFRVKKPSISGADQLAKIAATIIDCIHTLPGKLPRSGVAKLLVGSESERVRDFRDHPFYNRLAGHSRSEVLSEVNRLLADGQLAQEEKGHLILGKIVTVEHPSIDPVAAFLSRPHPRQLSGPWNAGWALGFHSQFTGVDWSRSEAGELAYRLKYQEDLSALPALVEQATALIADHPELAEVDAVVPVPPSKPRSHDPVSSFTNALAQQLDLEFLPVLIKSRQTHPQKEMHTLAQKRVNVAGAFNLKSPIKGKRLLVIDDLYDSGATLEEIYRLLCRSGATGVCVLTLTCTIHSEV